MKKKQYKRLEQLLTTLVESSIGNGAELHRIKDDARQIAETHAEGGAAILEAVRDVEVRIGITTERASDGQMAPVSHAAAQWAGKMGDDLVGPNPNLQREAVERMEGKLLTNAEDVARQGDPNPPNPPKPGETVARLQADVAKWRERAWARLGVDVDQNEKIRLIMHELTGNDRSNLTLPWAVRDCIMELVDTNDELQKKLAQEGEASSIYRSKMLENERQLKLAVGEAKESYNDLAKANQHLERKLTETNAELVRATAKQGPLPDDASMDRFIKWVGNHGWKWIVGHRGTINERLDRMEREAAYNRGNNVAPPRAIKDNPQA